MRRRKIGSLTPIWNHEIFIKPHFEMLSNLDRNVVLMQNHPLPNYVREHGIGVNPDSSRKILEENFSSVEILEGHYPLELEAGPELWNEGFRLMTDCDIVFRLDPDMFFTKRDWQALLDLIDETDFDCYRMDFHKDSINYYITGRFDMGLKDAWEVDPIAINPRFPLTETAGILEWPYDNWTMIKIPNWTCHHMRGWNKPKSFPQDWKPDNEKETLVMYGNKKRRWFVCPKEIQKKFKK